MDEVTETQRVWVLVYPMGNLKLHKPCRSEELHENLIKAYPKLEQLMLRLQPLPFLVPSDRTVPEAITRIVVGQMLSGAAAKTIYERMERLAEKETLPGPWHLSHPQMTSCGLSNRKAQTIIEFMRKYEEDPGNYDAWRSLTFLDLKANVISHWGLGEWTADMLAIFDFSHPDVYPETDGTILRVKALLEQNFLHAPLKPELAMPHRSYLARVMWALLDEGHLS